MHQHIDVPSIAGSSVSLTFTILGLATINNVAIIVGIVVGLSTIALNAVKIYNEILRGKIERDEQQDSERN